MPVVTDGDGSFSPSVIEMSTSSLKWLAVFNIMMTYLCGKSCSGGSLTPLDP